MTLVIRTERIPHMTWHVRSRIVAEMGRDSVFFRTPSGLTIETWRDRDTGGIHLTNGITKALISNHEQVFQFVQMFEKSYNRLLVEQRTTGTIN